MSKLYWIFLLSGFLLVVSSYSQKVEAASVPDPSAAADPAAYPDDEDYDEDEVPSNANPVITSKRKELFENEGKTVEFPCKGEHLEYFPIFWQKGDEILAASEMVVTEDPRFSLTDKGFVLVINNVTSMDNGEYKCKVTGPEKKELVLSHSLTVNEMPRVWAQPTKVVKENEPVNLTCNTTGYPVPIVYWERKGKKMPNGEQVLEANSVTFQSVSRHHAGTYECFANNSLGTARTAINLLVLHTPEIEIERESVNSGISTDAELVCLVHAEPKASVTWFKDGKIVSSDKHRVMQKQSHHWTLHIQNVQKEDFGNYVCVANNSLGRVHKAIELTGLPSQPMLRESVLGKDHMSYNLVWVLESASEVDSYKLRFRKVNGEWTEVDVKGQPAQTNVYTVSYTLSDLSPSTDYEATLIAHNQYGWSKEAKPRKFHINGEFQSLEADTEASAKGSSGASPSWASSCLVLLLSSIMLRWRME